MFLIIIYIFGFLSQHAVRSEEEDIESVIPIETPLEANESSSEEVLDDSSSVQEETEEDTGNDVESDEVSSDQKSEDDNNDESGELIPISTVNFAGPVNAKGSVSVAATYGYDSPYQPITFPPLNPIFHNIFYPLPYFPAFVPLCFNHGPLVSMFLENLGTESLENLLDDDIFLEITPLNYDVLPVKSDEDEDCGDGENQVMKNDGVVFGGLVPASGKVTIAAKF